MGTSGCRVTSAVNGPRCRASASCTSGTLRRITQATRRSTGGGAVPGSRRISRWRRTKVQPPDADTHSAMSPGPRRLRPTEGRGRRWRSRYRPGRSQGRSGPGRWRRCACGGSRAPRDRCGCPARWGARGRQPPRRQQATAVPPHDPAWLRVRVPGCAPARATDHSATLDPSTRRRSAPVSDRSATRQTMSAPRSGCSSRRRTHAMAHSRTARHPAAAICDAVVVTGSAPRAGRERLGRATHRSRRPPPGDGHRRERRGARENVDVHWSRERPRRRRGPRPYFRLRQPALGVARAARLSPIPDRAPWPSRPRLHAQGVTAAPHLPAASVAAPIPPRLPRPMR